MRDDQQQPDRGPIEAALIDVNEFAGKLAVSAKHIRRMADEGRVPSPIRLGKRVRWNRKDVDAWIDDGCPEVRRPRMTQNKRSQGL